MVAKVYADRLSQDADVSQVEPCAIDPDLEAEIRAVAAFFEALPAEWQAHFDREAVTGRRAYGQA
jgi:hypothetical protein